MSIPFSFWLGGWFTMMWVGIGSAVLGAGTSLYGANKQAKSVAEANATNDARLAEQNQSAWNAYLLSRGVNPAGAATGSLPSNPQPVNSKLPLWATSSFAKPGATKTWRKKGSGTPPVGTLARNTSFSGAPSSNPYVIQSESF